MVKLIQDLELEMIFLVITLQNVVEKQQNTYYNPIEVLP
jgi:hypothetical protein